MLKKIFISFSIIVLIAGAGIGYYVYELIYGPNVFISEGETSYLYIPTGSDFEDVATLLEYSGQLKNPTSFRWVAKKKNYSAHVHSGRYLLKKGMNNDDLVDMLRSGDQEAIRLTFNNLRLIEELAGRIAQQIEPDSLTMLKSLKDADIYVKYGFSDETFLSMFIPNTYELYWNTSPEEFITRLNQEYQAFWNEERKSKARKLGLTPVEVSILAAIVQKETKMNDEKPRVAGVYMNRINKGMLLQADPTLIFALKDFTIHRVLNKHKEVESPYNTYKYKGLPPGPITLPEISSLQAVLDMENHEYLFFCAKEDFSGYHNFAKTYAQHKLNARKFHQAMNKKKVFK